MEINVLLVGQTSRRIHPQLEGCRRVPVRTTLNGLPSGSIGDASSERRSESSASGGT